MVPRRGSSVQCFRIFGLLAVLAGGVGLTSCAGISDASNAPLNQQVPPNPDSIAAFRPT